MAVKRLLPATLGVCVMFLSGCLGNAMMLSDPTMQVEMMQGTGVVNVSPSGETTFRFVVNANAWDGLGLSPQQIEEARMTAIGNFLGEEKQCLDGYSITSKSLQEHDMFSAYVYEGKCT